MIKYNLLDTECKPYKGSDGSAGVDLRIDQDVVIRPGEVVSAGLGVRVEIPENTGLLLMPRSSSVIVLTNTIGLVDPDYRGELKIKMKNTSQHTLMFSKGERVVQAVLVPIVSTTWVVVSDQLTPTSRGDGGFGSTGSM
jgi:dUTP pyrophosphatase